MNESERQLKELREESARDKARHVNRLKEIQHRKALAARIESVSNELHRLVVVATDVLREEFCIPLQPITDELFTDTEDAHGRLKGMIDELVAFKGPQK